MGAVIATAFGAASVAGYFLVDRGEAAIAAGAGEGQGRAPQDAGPPGASDILHVVDQDSLWAPRFFVSDPRLLVQQPGLTTVREKAVQGPSEEAKAGVPYFILLADGRYAFGRTDDEGGTRPLFTERLVAHRVYWDEEAVSKARGAAVNPPKAEAPISTDERWKNVVEAASGPQRRLAAPFMGWPRHRTATAPRPYDISAVPCTGGPNVCCIAIAGDSEVARACRAGGRKDAKKVMKRMINDAKSNGARFACEQCHHDLDDYALNPEARDLFQEMLFVTRMVRN